jgi:maltose O-acetyltransferase
MGKPLSQRITPPQAPVRVLPVVRRVAGSSVAPEEPPSVEPAPPRTARRSFLSRLLRAARAEFAIDLRAQVAHLVSAGLPHFGFIRTRTWLLRAAGFSIGKGSSVQGRLCISGAGPARLLRIGECTAISGPLRVDLGGAPVDIGSRVRIGQDVMLLTMDHEIDSPSERCGRLVAAPVRIEDGVWIASRVTILPGITVGHGAVVAAGSLVASDVSPNTLVGGVPARVLRHLGANPPQSARLAAVMPYLRHPESENQK